MEQLVRPKDKMLIDEINKRRIRRKIDTVVKVKQINSGYLNARMSDISIAGFRLNSFDPLAVDASLFVIILGLEPLKSKIMWSNDTEYGCEFLNPLHPYILDHVLDTLSSAY